MKLDNRNLVILIILVAGIAFGAYTLGTKRAAKSGDSELSSTGSVASGDMAAMSGHADLTQKHPPFAEGTRDNNDQRERFTHFRVGNRNVKSLFQDGDFLWIGSSGGAIRYNTRTDEYNVFDNKVDGILSNGIFHVSKLKDRIVLGTYGGGMSILDPENGKWKNYNIPEGLADQFVYGVKEASNGDVWIATWSGANRVRQGRFDDEASWETFSVENTNGGLPNPWVYALREGKKGEMWFATEEGLARFKDGHWTNWKHEDGLGAPYDVVKDAIKSTNDPAKASQHHAMQKAEMGMEDIQVPYNPNYIISLEVDSDGIVWCGTWGGGLARFDGQVWRNYTTADGLPSNHIFMLYIAPNGQLWIGTSKGLARFNDDDNGFTVMTTEDGLFANNVFSMVQVLDGDTWVGSFGGIARLATGDI